ncbi:hypothetical protein ACP4OV_012202 [Aristida adscensionis]
MTERQRGSMESAAQSLIGNVGQLLAAEYRQLRGIGGEVAELRDDLDTMNALIRAVDHFVRVWMKQLRELAYDSEDRIDLYLLRIKCRHAEPPPRDVPRAPPPRRRDRRPPRPRRRRQRAPRAPLLAASSSAHALRRGDDDGHCGRHALVGIGDQADALARRLRARVDGEEGKLRVFSIVGFGGLGKTTLAMEACRRLEAELPYQAMVSVSQAFEPGRDRKALLRRVLHQLVKAKTDNEKGIKEEEAVGDINGFNDQELAGKLQQFVAGKRYLIVIDDVWTVRAWETIQSMLPKNNCDSRIIVTTRVKTVAQACSSPPISGHCIHNMEPLKPEDSKKLFLSRAFGSTDATYPNELQDAMDRILKKCSGLPLAIVSIASILVGYRSSGRKDKWETICKSIGSHMESDPTLEGMRQVITLSYNHLPHELKGCMMYLSIFPEDFGIGKDRLLRRWIAEGLVHQKRGMTLLEVAESYMDELLSRNIIEVDHFNYNKMEHTCRVHDMLLEHIRSLSMFQVKRHKLLDQLGKFTLLRVLDLEDCEGVTNRHVRYACQLHLLRFLSLRGTNISKVPPQVKNLEHLQTFDVRDTDLVCLPETIIKLERLERLQFYHRNEWEWDGMWRLPRGISKMKELREVDAARLGNNTHVAQELGNLEKLQELALYIGPENIDQEVLDELVLSIGKMHSLWWLIIGSTGDENTLNFLHHISTPPRLLRFLKIDGVMNELPIWFESLTYLGGIHISCTQLVADLLFGALCKLPKLKSIWLEENCYNGIELVARSSHKFLVLDSLRLTNDDELPKVLRFEEGSMVLLQNLQVNFGDKEKSIVGVEHLTNLKEVQLTGNKNNPALNRTTKELKAQSESRPESNRFQVVVRYG